MYPNFLKSIICRAKTVYFTKRFVGCAKNIKKTWDAIKEVSRPSMKPEGLLKSLIVDDQLVTEKGQIRHHMNKFFAEIGKKLLIVFLIPLCHSLGSSSLCLKSMVLGEVTVQEIRNIVLSLKNSSAGFDQISAKVIKHILPSIITPIYHLINRSFQLGVFLKRLKLARVIALFEGGDRKDPVNYRPIYLLSGLSKLFERQCSNVW